MSRTGLEYDLVPRTESAYVWFAEGRRAVFAARSIRAGEVVEAAPVVPVTREEIARLKDRHINSLDQYWYRWEQGEDPDLPLCIVLGFGSLYRHSSTPNLTKERDYDGLTILYRATRDVRPGEELTQDNGVDWDPSRYDPVDAALWSDAWEGRLARSDLAAGDGGFFTPGLELRQTEFGRGVFATRDYREGEMVEACPLVTVTRADGARLRGSRIHAVYGYWFAWFPPDRPHIYRAIVLGYGGLYNHSRPGNLMHTDEHDLHLNVFWATRDIKAGEELTHDYGNYPKTRLRPVDKNMLPVSPER